MLIQNLSFYKQFRALKCDKNWHFGVFLGLQEPILLRSSLIFMLRSPKNPITGLNQIEKLYYGPKNEKIYRSHIIENMP